MKVLNLPPLHYRRYRGDMIAVYNMLHDKYDIDYSDFFTFSPITNTPEVTHLSYLNIFQEQMPGNNFLQDELLNHGITYPKK